MSTPSIASDVKPVQEGSAHRLMDWHFREYATLWGWCSLLTAILHVGMLYKVHDEGDELVYFALAEQMDWDLSNYSTQGDPRISRFPYSIYRQPLFHHPPLYPLLLKIGLEWTENPLLSIPDVRTTPRVPKATFNAVASESVAMAYMISVAMSVATLWYTWRFCALEGIDPSFGGVAMAGILFCPLVLFSTCRLHHDGLAGLALFCGLVAFAEALSRKSLFHAVEAGTWIVVALNLRFNIIASIPLIVAMPFYVRDRRDRAWWQVSLIVWGLTLTLGLQHYYRLLAVYGTLMPGSLIVPDRNVAEFSGMMKSLSGTTRLQILFQFLAIFPISLLLFDPSHVKQLCEDFRSRRWSVAAPIAMVFLFGVTFAASFQQLRYFAMATPFLFITWPRLLKTIVERRACCWSLLCLFAVTFFLMATTAFDNTCMSRPSITLIRPSLFILFPSLL